MAEDGRIKLRDLCGRVAAEQDPLKLRKLIAELSLLLEGEEERRQNESPAREPQ
jgi:hypothetical protein